MSAGGAVGAAKGGKEDLVEHIESNGVYALNVRGTGDHWKGILRGGGCCLTSDADDQLIVYIPFRSPVKLRTIKVEAPEGKPAPSNMKVFVNRPTIGFEEVEDEPATQSFELESENLTTGGKPVETHFTKFRQVSTLHLFFQNPEEEEVNVSRLQFFGETREAVNVSELKKSG